MLQEKDDNFLTIALIINQIPSGARSEIMKKPTLRQRLQYHFDNYMARGTVALIIGLGVVSMAVILLAAAFIRLAHVALEDDELSFGEAAWMSLMRTLDPGTMGDDSGLLFRAIMLFVTLGGIFIVSTLIGIVNNGLESRLDQLRKGRSLVLENDHTLILGWTPQIFTIIEELVLANENRSSGAIIVVLADQDKVQMEDAIRERVPDRKNTRIICRSGNPIDPNDLEIVSPHTARSIIILPPENNDPDTDVIKTGAGDHQQPQPPRGTVSHRHADPTAGTWVRDEHARRKRDYRASPPIHRPDRPHRRADLASDRAFGGVHRTAEFQRR
jgi:hypothetical protein